MKRSLLVTLFVLIAVASPVDGWAQSPKPLKLLFLGDRGHHQPAKRFEQWQPVARARGLDVTYTENVADLNPERLAAFDGLIVFANIDAIAPRQAEALLDYVASGKGFIPLHCASFCFRNNDQIVALMGAQFLRHGTGVFRVSPTEAGRSHPLLRDYGGFESWDETYVHTKHNEKDRTVLEYRDEQGRREPWTWVRTHGKGRVFYTAWGHDERTWSNPGFQNLVERGIRWACGDEGSSIPAFIDRPATTTRRKDVQPFEYVDADVPYYPPGQRWGTITGGKRKMQLPVSPEESQKHMVTPAGFQVAFYAAEPMLAAKPLSMNWDERGRVWICESVDYPNELQPRGQGHDRIRILEDIDGDGKADKTTVFAEQLSIPTTLAFYRGGVIVQSGRETVYLKDTNGDDQADIRKVLVTGWSLGDTHGGVSNFQYGLDNWYYAMQGYNPSEPVYDDGKKKSLGFRMGFFRFKVEGQDDQTVVKEIEFLRSTNNNTWGLGLSEEGLVFGSTANNNPSEFMPIANRYYESVLGWSSSALNGIADSNRFEPLDPAKVRQVDQHGGFTAAAGHALYTARNYPREYWNRTAFVTEPTGHLIATFVLRPDGAGFRSKNSWNLLASDDEWTAPIMAEVGPDGNVWWIDWYNFIVQHNPTPAGFRTGRGNAYESNLRDKSHGRIYRLLWTGAPASSDASTAAIKSLANASPDKLVAALRSDNFFWRRQAQRLLVEGNHRSVAPQLIEMASSTSVDPIGLNTSVIHAMWTLHGLGLLENGQSDTAKSDTAKSDTAKSDAAKCVVKNLEHSSAGVRRNSVLVVPRQPELAQRVGAMAASDPDSQVRLAACLASCDFSPSPKVAEAMLAAIKRPGNLEDKWMRDAITAAAAKHDFAFLNSLDQWAASNASAAQNAGELPDAAKDIVRRVAEHYARGKPVTTIGQLLTSLAKSTSSDTTSAVLAGLAAGWPKDQPLQLDERFEQTLVDMFQRAAAAQQAELVVLGSRWGSKKLEGRVAELSKTFLDVVKNSEAPEADRIKAAVQLVEFRNADAASVREILDLITPRSTPTLSQGFIDAVGKSESAEAGKIVAERLPTFTPQARATGLRILLMRTEWTEALIDALTSGKLPFGDLTLDQKQALASHPNRGISRRARELLSKGGGLPNPDRQKVVDELMPLTQQTGNATAGKAVFMKTCAKCHTHSGEGTKIGPDLTGMAVHPKHELLIHIADPSRSVEGNFRIYSVVTDDGRVLQGLLASETKTAIELIDAEAKKHTILRENIEQLVASTKSLMPEGFEKQHTPQEIADLLEFLTARGKFLSIPIEKYATVVSTKGMFNSESAGVERLIFSDWSPKTFEGVPFVLVDPQGDKTPNVIMLQGEHGTIPPRMPRNVQLPCNSQARAIHFLSGISGWGFPAEPQGGHTMTVRLNYEDGENEDHLLTNGEHFADYIRRVDVPGSKFAFALRGQQVRFFSVLPKRTTKIASIELIKGRDRTAPVVMAITVESP